MGAMNKIPFALARGSHPGPSVEQTQMAPEQIWVGLTLEQQRRVFQQLVSICCHLVQESSIRQEESDEQR
jgi:hypothetical protein